jgi:magnesium transporter
MAPDEATDLLADLPKDQQRRFIGKMDKPSREAVEELLKFKEGTAGSIMTKDYLAVSTDTTIGQAIEAFRQTTCPLESIAYIYIADPSGRLAGVCTLRHLIILDKNTLLGDVMNTRLVTVDPQEKVRSVTDIFKKYKFLALPVADAEGVLRGIITLKDILQEELDE